MKIKEKIWKFVEDENLIIAELIGISIAGALFYSTKKGNLIQWYIISPLILLVVVIILLIIIKVYDLVKSG